MVNFDLIFKEVENIEKESIMEIMRSLISIDTTTPPGNSYRQYVDTISPYFIDLGFDLEEIIIPEDLIKQIPFPLEGPRINLVATKNYNQEKEITFYGHMEFFFLELNMEQMLILSF